MPGSSRRNFIKRSLALGGCAITTAESGALAQSAGVRGFDHVALPMLNVDAMLQFYRALGFQVKEGAAACSVHFGSQMINFHRPEVWQRETTTLRAPAAKPPCGDLCFLWEGTPAALKAMIDKVGASIETGPVERVGGRQVAGSSVYIRDPDKNLLEFIIYS